MGRVSGGVDVFFVLTGFFITRGLLKEADCGGVGLRQLWARIIKRLFPAGLLVLGAVVVAGVLVLPQSRWQQTIAEVVASAVYVENWRLAADSADYFAQHNDASVVQHFWSLSIQGQFYLVWPLIVAGIALVARRLRISPRPAALCALLAAFFASLACSVRLTALDQSVAYFSSFTRIWEFALGGLLVFVPVASGFPRWAKVVLGWGAVIALVLCGLVLRLSSQFPGYVALWPTLCAAAIVLAGRSQSPYGVDRLLGSRPLGYAGDISYPMYLWHWPVLVFSLILWDRPNPGVLGGAGVIASAVLLAVLTHRFVERLTRDSGPGLWVRWGVYRFCAAALAAVLLAAQCWQWVGAHESAALAAAARNGGHPGAMALGSSAKDDSEPDVLVPSLMNLSKDFVGNDEFDCAKPDLRPELDVCVLRSSERERPQFRVALVGYSHITQLIPAVEPLARERNWQLLTVAMGACPFSTASEAAPGDESCVRHNAETLDELLEMKPDVVIANGSRDARVGLTEQTPQGFVDAWRRLNDGGIRVFAVQDNPRFSFSPARCVEIHGQGAAMCNTPRADVLKPVPPYAALPDVPPNVSFFDLSDYICARDVCPQVIGNVYVYMDDNHLSGTYASTMGPIIAPMIEAALAEAH